MRKFLLALTVTSLAAAGHAQQLLEPDFLEMAKASATVNGIPVTEAIRRVDLQGASSICRTAIWSAFPTNSPAL
jgi:hypothetical protein